MCAPLRVELQLVAEANRSTAEGRDRGVNDEHPRPCVRTICHVFDWNGRDRVRETSTRARPPVSQEALADLAGVHRTYISHLELGKGSPTLDTIVRVASALAVDPPELLPGLRPS